MKTLTPYRWPYLWKEWREHRATLGALAVVLPVLVALAAWLVPRKTFFADPIIVTSGVLLCMLAAALTVGGELLSGDARGTRLRFLERLPAGLGRAFTAKLLVYLAALAAAGLYGWLLVGTASLVRAGTFPTELGLVHRLALPATAVALWTFAVSAWVPRGSLSLPGGLLTATALGWPVVLYFALGSDYRLDDREWLGLFGLLDGGALLAAHHSYVRGRRLARPAWKAALQGMVIGVVLVLPAWGWAGWRIRAVYTLEPGTEGFGVEAVLRCEDGRHALVFAWQDRSWLTALPIRTVHVDLETGAWSLDDAPACLARIPDEPVDWAGLGWRQGRRGGGYFDPFRERFFHVEDVIPDERERRGLEVLVGPERWLLNGGHPSAWFAFDPETGERTELDWPDVYGYANPMLPDGRIFLAEGYELFLGDPADGSLTRVAAGGLFGLSVYNAVDFWAPLDSAPGVPLLVRDDDCVFRFDPETLTAKPTAIDLEREWILEAEPGGTVLLLRDQARIVRLDLDTGHREVLFPREPRGS